MTIRQKETYFSPVYPSDFAKIFTTQMTDFENLLHFLKVCSGILTVRSKVNVLKKNYCVYKVQCIKFIFRLSIYHMGRITLICLIYHNDT